MYVNGSLTEEDVSNLMDFDFQSLVTFYIGCSFSFEEALIKGGVPMRNIEMKRNIPMYKVRQ